MVHTTAVSDYKWKKVRDGSSWAEKQIDRIPKDQRGGLKYEQLLGRLVAYLRSGMNKEIADDRVHTRFTTLIDYRWNKLATTSFLE